MNINNKDYFFTYFHSNTKLIQLRVLELCTLEAIKEYLERDAIQASVKQWPIIPLHIHVNEFDGITRSF